ncbi:hypothetical protein O9X98_14805 [Agrobacterium salinitolerans]|nr:hypothetical protein [Agrobacterium salinitolerans]
MRQYLALLAVIATLGGCTTTSGTNDQVTSSIQDYRSCTVKTMAQNLGGTKPVDIKATVDRICASHMNKFGTELKNAGVSQSKVRVYQSQLRTATLQYSTAAIAAIMYRADAGR